MAKKKVIECLGGEVIESRTFGLVKTATNSLDKD